eukprot:TRINITY_DN599_c0_g1_i1.p1 TRINITY_DN599_c0_g1~~TRINITY_DN599_c0_g1_i1.p1  ORF type:complete len:177 (-),score=25.59 TRINITY_DN599_c0_g1_i1:27-557(-)
MLRTVLKFNRQIFFKPRLQVDKVHIRNFVFYNHKKMSRNWQEETKDKLTDFEKYVLWEKGTERSGTGEYDNFYPKKGYFVCKACNTALYSAVSKFKSGCGWPAFDKIFKGSVKVEIDDSFGMRRIEIMCNTCGGHLGHVFEGERFTETNERHCVNSASITYVDTDVPDKLVESKVL